VPRAATHTPSRTPTAALPAPRPAETFRLRATVPGRLVTLRGRLDVAAAADARLGLADAVREGSGELVLDLSELDSVDATGLGVLVGAHRHAGRAGRRAVLLDVPEQVSRLLLVTRLHRVLHTATSASCA
jgi:anti-anti-sigma factor